MLSIFDGSTCVVDVRYVEINGKKRKLLLTNDGDVYKLKKSKLEETIKPGFVQFKIVDSFRCVIYL